jgi:hypothetical protein
MLYRLDAAAAQIIRGTAATTPQVATSPRQLRPVITAGRVCRRAAWANPPAVSSRANGVPPPGLHPTPRAMASLSVRSRQPVLDRNLRNSNSAA